MCVNAFRAKQRFVQEGAGQAGYHPRKAVPKTAVPKTAVNRPIIEFGGTEGFFIGEQRYAQAEVMDKHERVKQSSSNCQ